jgi:hypothetical protein
MWNGLVVHGSTGRLLSTGRDCSAPIVDFDIGFFLGVEILKSFKWNTSVSAERDGRWLWMTTRYLEIEKIWKRKKLINWKRNVPGLIPYILFSFHKRGMKS